ncbi:MAG: glycosyltransferase family 9 protein [Bdellovibrionaceae bacterium]|nr:glycosyltransferase family 9 protein [Pseudobdellovibrionaceae bacterium]
MDRGNPLLRTLDQGLGPWLLRVVALWRLLFARGRRRPAAPRVIGVIKAAALGDTILLSAVLSDLKAAWPEARVILFAGSTNAGLAREFAGIEVVELPLRRPWVAVSLLRNARYDWMIDADAWPRISALWAVLSGARWVIGFRTSGQRRHFAFDQFIDHDPSLHEIANYRNLLRAMDVRTGAPPQNPRQWIGTELPADFSEMRARFPRVVALHFWPGGTKSAMKEWPFDSWRSFMERVARDARWMFVLSGAKADRPRIEEFLATLPTELRARVYDGGGLNLNTSLAVLAAADALVSVNTGILHLGAAMGVPVLGLHGATNPRRWGPVGDKHISVVSSHPAAGCLNLGFEYPAGDPPIMAGLSVDVVYAGWRNLVMKNSLDFRGEA